MKESKKFTRKEYMDHVCSHREYYAQYVTEGLKKQVLFNIPISELEKSKDEHLNDVELKRWDNVPMPYSVSTQMKENGDYLTQAGIVCIAKEAARQILEGDHNE